MSYQNTEKSSLLKTNGLNDNASNARKLWSSSLSRILWLVSGVVLGILLNQGFEELKKHPDSNPFFPILTSHLYDKTQALGFQIYTGGAPSVNNVTKELNSECDGHKKYGLLGDDEEAEFLCYVGNSKWEEDVKARLDVMKTAVERAYEVADPDPTTLKLFIAPEFFFRGIDGAYAFDKKEYQDESESFEDDDCGPVCHILKGLEKMVADARFEHWLFLFGTVVAYDKLPAADQMDYLYYNFAPIYKGYDPSKSTYHGRRFLLPKRYLSTIDFLIPLRHVDMTLALEVVDQRLLPFSEATILDPRSVQIKRYHSDMWYQYKDELNSLGYAMIEYDWIIVDGITMTIEVCFDHFHATALSTYMADMVTGSTTRIPKLDTLSDQLSYVSIPRHQAHVSIVSSAGMTINPEAIALAHNGTIYLLDGLYNDEAKIIYPDNTQGTFIEFDGGSEGVRRKAVLTKSDVFFQYEIVEEYEVKEIYKNETAWMDALQGSFSAMVYEPKLVVWAPTEIPLVDGEVLKH